MTSIIMTAEQTATYDAGNYEAAALMSDLRAAARAKATATGKTCEIRTADGIVADAVTE